MVGCYEPDTGAIRQVHRILQRMIETTSGRRAARDELGLGEEELVRWQLGAVM